MNLLRRRQVTAWSVFIPRPATRPRAPRCGCRCLPLASGLGPRDSNSAPTATVQGYDGQCAVSPRPPPDGRDRRDTFRPAMTTSPLRTGRAIPSVKLAAPVWIGVGFYTREYIGISMDSFFDRYKYEMTLSDGHVHNPPKS